MIWLGMEGSINMPLTVILEKSIANILLLSTVSSGIGMVSDVALAAFVGGVLLEGVVKRVLVLPPNTVSACAGVISCQNISTSIKCKSEITIVAIVLFPTPKTPKLPLNSYNKSK
jgi:hypothetical protein